MGDFHVLVELDLDFELAQKDDAIVQAVAGQQKAVRRPMRGVMLKKEAFASLTVLSANNSLVEMKNSSAAGDDAVNFTSNFILTGVQQSRSEKFQALSTFGATYGFFFGEQPRIMNFTAVLLNTADFQWELEWWTNYEDVLRGTRLVDRQARVFLTFDEQTVEGYLLSASTSKDAQNLNEVPLSFQMWVTNVTHTQKAGDRAPIQKSGGVFDSEDLSTLTPELVAKNNAAVGSSKVGLLAKLRSALASAENFVDGAMSNLKNFLYGRNLVIPAGFAGSERYAGRSASATFPDISTSISVKMPSTFRSPRFTSHIYDNIDEYPARAGDASELSKLRADAESQASTRFVDRNFDAVMQAEEAFGEAGFRMSNMTGLQSSDFMRTMGKVTYAAVSYTAAATGASQAVASVTPGSVTGEVADATYAAAGA